MSVGDKDVLWPLLVDTEAGVEEEVELGDDEGCVPSRAGSARQNEVVVWPREFPFQHFGACWLWEGRGKGYLPMALE